MTDKYIIVRHISGEDIIGKLVYDDKDIITIDDAMVMRIGYNDSGSTPYLYLFKYMLYDSSYTVTLKKDQIISTHAPLPAVTKYHSKMVAQVKAKQQLYSTKEEYDEDMLKAIMEKITGKNTLQ
jgi:hypothetical protein